VNLACRQTCVASASARAPGPLSPIDERRWPKVEGSMREAVICEPIRTPAGKYAGVPTYPGGRSGVCRGAGRCGALEGVRIAPVNDLQGHLQGRGPGGERAGVDGIGPDQADAVAAGPGCRRRARPQVPVHRPPGRSVECSSAVVHRIHVRRESSQVEASSKLRGRVARIPQNL
jgi:hypothetical protein